VTGVQTCALPISQLVAHRQDDSRICEGEEKRDIDDSPDHEWDVPSHNSAEDHAAADNQSALPIAPAPDGNCGIHRKDKQQQQTEITKKVPGIRYTEGH